MNAVQLAHGRARWAEGDYLSTLASAYRAAIDAAIIIDQRAVADEWEADWREVESAAVKAYAEAKSLGHFGPGT